MVLDCFDCTYTVYHKLYLVKGECKSWNAEWNGIWNGYGTEYGMTNLVIKDLESC